MIPINLNGVNELDLDFPGTTAATISAGVTTIINRGFQGVRKVTSSPDTILTTDNQKLVDYSSGSAVAVTLPLAGSAGFDNHFVFWVSNIGAGSVTITPTGCTIDGNATLVLDQGSGATIFNDGSNYFTVAGGGAATGLQISIHQVAHGFSTGDAIYFTGSVWAKAEANAGGTLGIGIATFVGADDFKVTTAGFIKNLTGLTAGEYYFVSDATPGLLTSTEPTTALNYSNPLLLALTTTTGIVLPFRPSKIEQAASVIDLTGQSAAIAATLLYAIPSGQSGTYEISWSATVTTVDGTSSSLGGSNGLQIVYTSPTDSVVKTTSVDSTDTSSTNTTAASVGGAKTVYAKANTNIQYKFDYTSNTPGQMIYELHLSLKKVR